MTLNAHIWPPKSPLVSYRGIGSLAERQGFYIYRNDRLVQAAWLEQYPEPGGSSIPRPHRCRSAEHSERGLQPHRKEGRRHGDTGLWAGP